MPDFLLELFSEEIPARMQAKAAEDLRKLVTDRLVAAGLLYDGARAFATPRRLALTVHGLPARQADVKEERKGPRVGAPEGAINGFLKAAGLTSIDQAKVQGDKKGDFYVAVIEKPGRAAIEVIAEIVPEVVRSFPWPKSMRWGDGALTWVRPLHSILATFGPETEEPEIVPIAIDGVVAGNVTRGHRFLAPDAIVVRRLDDYMHKLEAAKVVIDSWRREQMILADAKDLAFAQGYELVEDPGLLAEVAGLVEWPVVLMGSFDEAFLAIPPEVIRTTIRNNQKCFVLRHTTGAPPSPLWGGVGGGGRAVDRGTAPTPALRADPPHKSLRPGARERDPGGEGEKGRLANKFILVANTEAADGGAAIIAGNERVIRARLADAKFFYETDLKTKLEDRLPKFEQIVFHEKLGTQAERIARIERLAAELAPLVGAEVEKAKRAARLCKADLLTDMVGEFPELQGLMGKYYAHAQGEDESVAATCEDHYKPHGPSDSVPTDAVSIAVALADKIDTLIGFWAIDEKPTGSKDPYALRRAALGVIRNVLENGVRLSILEFLRETCPATFDENSGKLHLNLAGITKIEIDDPEAVYRGVLNFLADRLKVLLRDQGSRHDLVDAVFGLGDQDDFVLIVRRIESLAKLLDSEDGTNLLIGYRRAANILGIEEKRDDRKYTGAPNLESLRQEEERALADAIWHARLVANSAIGNEDFAAAMTAMAHLRPHVDAFFDMVTVNVDDKALRENRLILLNQIREATRAVADFSRIEG